ncbi:MAG TPA: hypothetical protein GXX70_04250 [Tepidimicrobium sp.]|nr:hypothetical protein [Tepidimicrobium sp.]
MRDNIENLLSRLFSLFILIAISGGGLIFILFVIALILGGEAGESLAISASSTIMPYFIKAAAIAIVTGLATMYANRMHTLTLRKPSEKN